MSVHDTDVILLPRLCDEPLWNSSASWYTEVPHFGRCVERTVLLWLPCLVLWVTTPFHAVSLKWRPHDPVPWSGLAYTKVTVTCMMMVTAAAEGVWAAVGGYGTVTTADILAPPVLLLTYMLYLCLLVVGRRRGERSSGIQGGYWLLTVVANTPQLATAITTTLQRDNRLPPVLVATTILQYLGALVLFVASCMNDVPSHLQKLTRTENPSPELDASFLNRLLYVYAFPLVWHGWWRSLTYQDLPDVLPVHSARTIYEDLRHIMDGRKERHTWQEKQLNDEGPTISTETKAKVSLLRSIWKHNLVDTVLITLYCFSSEALGFLNPVLVGLLVTFIETPDEPAWHGFLYAMCLLIVGIVRSLFNTAYLRNIFVTSIRVRTSLMAAIYNKAIQLSSASRRDFTVGKIANLMAVDTETIGEVYLCISNVIVSPIIILMCIFFIWAQLGPSSLAGLVMLVLLLPLNTCIQSRSVKVNMKAMAVSDDRVKDITEIISGIKVLKLYGWEAAFAENVKHIRDKELQLMKDFSMLQAVNLFLFNAIPFIIAVVTFTFYLLVSEENQLDQQKTFICLALFDMLREPVISLPEVISKFVSGTVSFKRIEAYLKAEELDPLAVTANISEDVAVKVDGGCFSWEGNGEQASWRLTDINMHIPHGKLVALVGSIGAGKSSILSTLLGEMKKDAGRVVVNGSVAYVPQIPWVQNASLRDNITWGKPYDPMRFWRVVRASALQPDLDMLPASDMTEIGENGINISGGQKQRVSLARALYSDADIYLLDDPLSAVDSHVGRHLFEHVVGPNGLLKNKTRILVTHSVTFLPQVDEVVVVGKGRLLEQGSYASLLAADGHFAKFMVQHINELEDEAEEELEVLCNHLEVTDSRVSLCRQLSATRESMKSGGSTMTDMKATEANLHHHTHMLSSPETPRGLSHSLWSVGRRSSSSREQLHLQRQLSISSSTYRNGSVSSLNKHATKDKHELQPLAGNVEGQKLVEEETSETGRVSFHIYSVYGRAMGMFLAITGVVCLALAQIGSVGSSVWLAHWSSSQTSLFMPSINVTGSLNFTDSTSFTETIQLQDSMNLTNSVNFTDIIYFTNSTAFTDGTDLTGNTPVDRDVFLTVYGTLAMSQSLFLFLGILLMVVGSYRASNTLHSRLLDSVIHLPMSFFDTNPSGRIINRFGKETNSLDDDLPWAIRMFFLLLIQILVTLVVIIITAPSVMFFMVPAACIYFAIQQIYIPTSRQVQRFESTSKSPIYSHFSESIKGVSVVRPFKRQNEFFSHSLDKIDNSLKSFFTRIMVSSWLGINLEGLGNLITFAAALFGVANRETTTTASLGLSITYALSITMMLNWLVRSLSDVETSIVAVEKIYEYIQMPQEEAWRVKNNIPPPAWPEEGAISFQNYKTRYRPGLSLVLKDITCFIRPAEKVGIVGRTGAGKSSLTMALFRIIEASGGKIDIDNKAIASIGLHDLRGQISIIPQDAILFSGTLRMNLDPLNRHSDAELWRSLELAHLSAYIRQQVLGLQHPVEQGGANFSAGQRQLVCLARALLRHSQVLVLDEATAAVDLETDDLIQATIRTQFADCTVITIAHRLNTIMDSDRVMVLQAGTVAEFDTPANLLKQQSSIFYSMAKNAGMI